MRTTEKSSLAIPRLTRNSMKRKKPTETDRNGQKQKRTDRNGQKRTETDTSRSTSVGLLDLPDDILLAVIEFLQSGKSGGNGVMKFNQLRGSGGSGDMKLPQSGGRGGSGGSGGGGGRGGSLRGEEEVQLGEKFARGVAALRCVSRGAKELADGNVEILRCDMDKHYRPEPPESTSCALALFQATLLRHPLVTRLALGLPRSRISLVPRLLSAAASVLPRLLTLDLHGTHCALSGPDLPPFPHLHTLTISNIHLLSSAARAIASLPSLHTLTLHLPHLPQPHPRLELPHLPRLHHLTVTARPVSASADNTGPCIMLPTSPTAPWSALRTLTLKGCSPPPRWAPPAAVLPTLTALHLLIKLPVSDVHRAADPYQLTTLQSLSLGTLQDKSGLPLPPLRSRCVDPLRGLKTLYFSNVHAGSLSGLKNLTALESFTLRRSTATTLDRVATLPALRTLHIDLKTPLATAPCVVPLAALARTATRLETLHLHGCALPPTDCAALTELRMLRSLTLDNVAAPDPPSLTSLRRLRHLALKRLKLKSPPPLAHLTSLRVLELESVGEVVFSHLAMLTALEAMHLRHVRAWNSEMLWVGIPSLHSLTLHNVVTPVIDGLHCITDLKKLAISHFAPGPSSPITGLTTLEELELTGSVETLPWIISLVALHKLDPFLPPTNGLPIGWRVCKRLRRLHLLAGAAQCLDWVLGLPWLEELRFEDLPKGAWWFKRADWQLVVRGPQTCSLKGGPTNEVRQLNVRALISNLAKVGITEFGGSSLEAYEGDDGNADEDVEVVG